MSKQQLLVKHRKGKWVQRFYWYLRAMPSPPTEDNLAYLVQHAALGRRIREDAVACGCGPRMIGNIDLILLQIQVVEKKYREALK